MLNIFNKLKPFFENVKGKYSVREYARLVNVSPPTASKILKTLVDENILILVDSGFYLFFSVNFDNSLFKDLHKSYWRSALREELLKIHDVFLFRKIILFGSIQKGENLLESDIDLFIDMPKKEINLDKLGKKFNKVIQLHFLEVTKNEHLLKNIQNGWEIL